MPQNSMGEYSEKCKRLNLIIIQAHSLICARAETNPKNNVAKIIIEIKYMNIISWQSFISLLISLCENDYRNMSKYDFKNVNVNLILFLMYYYRVLQQCSYYPIKKVTIYKYHIIARRFEGTDNNI